MVYKDDDDGAIEDKLMNLLNRLIQDALVKKIVIDEDTEKRLIEYEEQKTKWEEEQRQEELKKHKKKLIPQDKTMDNFHG